MTKRLTLMLFIAAICTACSSNPIPPPVTDSSSRAPIERTVETVDPDEIDSRPATSEATAVLLAQASAAEQASEHDNARVYLERAIRLEPRNAELWTALARSHLQSGNLGSANQHVRKAIALAGNDQTLVRMAWLTLADIKDAEGDDVEARSIRRRYDRVRG